MAIDWTASDVTAGEDITSEQYNDLRDDIEAVYNASVPIGTILMWAGTSSNIPEGFLACDGSAINRTTYSDLFTIQGTTFGSGNESTTFNLPNMRDRFVVGAGNDYSQNAKGGATTNNISHTHSVGSHTHTTPAHTHTVGSHTHTDGDLTVDMDFVYNTGGGIYYNTVAKSFTANTRNYLYGGETAISSGRSNSIDITGNTGSGGAATTSNEGNGTTGSGGSGTTGSGGSTSVENRPLYIGIFYIIKVL